MINSRLDEIMSKKGCDASNMYDEEVHETEQDFSDDEIEKEAKRLRKNLKRTASKQDSDMEGDEELEEGELPKRQGKLKVQKKRTKQFGRGGRPA